MFQRAFFLVYTAAALVSISQCAVTPKPSPVSLCPELFHYETTDKPGQWSGSLILRSDERLSGVWIRLVFDKEVKDVTVDQNGFEIKKDDDKKQVRVHNRNLLLEAETEKILKITVTYDGSETPSLIEYRLNARTKCPQANIDRKDVFQGDSKSDYFLPSLNTSNEIIPQPTEYKCGIPHASNPHPWLASIYIKIDNEVQFVCEATLLSPTYVITAAHCVTFKNQHTVIPRAFVTVYLGQEGAAKDAVRSVVADIKVHPGYIAGSLLDDVALIKLASPVQVSDVLRPICLGETKGNDTKAVIVGHQVGNEGQIGKLLESRVLMIDFVKCEKVAPHIAGVLTYELYCLSYKSGDKNCVGDSGSGLIVTGTEGISTLDGIVSLGVKLQNKNTCDDNSVVLVSEIDRYLSWIKHIVY